MLLAMTAGRSATLVSVTFCTQVRALHPSARAKFASLSISRRPRLGFPVPPLQRRQGLEERAIWFQVEKGRAVQAVEPLD